MKATILLHFNCLAKARLVMKVSSKTHKELKHKSTVFYMLVKVEAKSLRIG